MGVMPMQSVQLELGVTTRAPESMLVERAADFLSGGPAPARELLAHVCQLSGLPELIAEHMAATLLAEHRRFTRDSAGRWCLSEHAPARYQVSAALVAAPAPSLLTGTSYVVVDVETTGGRPQAGDRMTEIAAVVVRDGEIVDRFETLLNPDRPIPPFITQLTNITWSMVKDAPRFGDVCERVLSLMEGHVFVAHNAAFDWRFVSAEVKRVTGRELDGRKLCTVRLARRVLPQLRRRSLDFVAAHYGIEIGARHRAMGDADATAQALVRMLRDVESSGCRTWGDLERLLSPPATKRRRRRASALPHSARDDASA